MAAYFIFLLSCLLNRSWGQTVSTIGPDSVNITDCAHNKADIVFLLDSSSSEGSTNFHKQVDFVLNFTNAYEIGPDHVQVSVVTFSSSPHNNFYLNAYQDKASLQAAIQKISYIGGTTYTGSALKFVRQTSFMPNHGARYGVPKILVVLTDGQSSNPTSTKTEANILKLADIKVISIGIGSGVSQTELNTIATDAAHAFTVPSFDSLQLIEKEIQNAACVSEKVETCNNKHADIVFVLDSSSSEGQANFFKELEFVANFTEKFDIGPNGVQISLVTFSGTVNNEFFLNTYSNRDDIKDAVANATYIGTTTATNLALRFVRENSFKPENGGRGNGVSQLVVVLTDGQSSSHYSTVSEAKLLHQKGIKVISVGIGSSVSQSELTDIATDAGHVFNVKDFNALGSIESQIERAACRTPLVCGSKPSDIVFILDSSSSEGAANFQKQLDFVTSFAKEFDIGPSGVQIGLITFASLAHNEFYLNGYTDKLSLLAAIQAVRYRPGTTHTDDGLRYARSYQFTSYHGARPNASQVAIVLTDGRSYDVSRTVVEAQRLKDKGVTVVAVGIGSNVNQYEINSIASDRQHAFSAGSFDILHTLLEDIKDESCGVNTPTPKPLPDCGNKPADIVFVLDSSASEGSSNFHKQLDFVRDFVYQFQIGPQDVQVSIVRFSSTAREIFPFNRYSNRTSLLKAIAAVTYNSGSTYTDRALSLVRNSTFLQSKGARDNATHIVVVITDGQSTYPSRTEKEAFLLKNSTSVDLVVAIGIGSGVKHDELVKIASDQSHALAVANFESLQTLMSELTFVTCNTCTFLSKADIVFLLDASSSEGSAHFQKQLDFVSRTVNDFKIGQTSVQIGVLTFSTTPTLEFYLNQYTTKAQVLSQIQSISYSGGTTHTDEAIQFARNNMFTAQHGDRADAPNFVIILTDGASADENATLVEARLLKQQGVQVIAIGIGDSINKAELEGMASDKSHVFEVSSFDALRTIREDLKLAGCEEVTTTTTPPPTTTPTTTLPPTTTFTFDCKVENQTTADPNDCSRYYRCTGGQLLHETCPSGNHYNPSDFLCDIKGNVPGCI